ncbi:hypothetical protein ACHAXT_006950 [Thalassiosira profunda]
MYCGDETGAFIGDVGSHTSRFGYGGEDCPKVVVPSAAYLHYGDGRKTTNDNQGNGRRGKYSAPVSLMRAPPDDCFSEEEVGFVPIYQSLNANNGKNRSTGRADAGLIQDIDAWTALWEYSYQSLCVRGKGKHIMGHKYQAEPELQPEGAAPSSRSKTISSQSAVDGPIDHPLLAVDSTSRNIPAKDQEQQWAAMLEAMFESLSAPAAYLAPSPMLSSFAYGRQTALVVDVGHTGSRVTPLVDGYCLSSGSVTSGRGGKWLGDVQKSVLEGVWDVNGVVNKWNGWGKGGGGSGAPPCRDGGIVPRYLLAQRYPDDRLGVLKRSSLQSMTIHEAMYEMMTSPHVLPLEVGGAGATPFYGYGVSGETADEDNDVEMEEKKDEEDEEEDEDCYALPDGTIVNLSTSQAGRDLRRLPELLFSETLPSFMQPQSNDNSSYSESMLPLQKLVHKSLTQILDIDLRKELSSNIIVAGGAYLFPNLDKRLSAELSKVLPSSNKYKVIASKNSVENRYSAWIGGSILSSLGSFQQLWLSKKEYEECGPLLSLQRFKN